MSAVSGSGRQMPAQTFAPTPPRHVWLGGKMRYYPQGYAPNARPGVEGEETGEGKADGLPTQNFGLWPGDGR